MTVAPTLAAEAEAIRDRIEALRSNGIPYEEQVILARTHLTLARITGILEQSRHQGGANYTFADGSARYLKFGKALDPVNMLLVNPIYRTLGTGGNPD